MPEDSLGNKCYTVFVLCGVYGLAADDKHMNRQIKNFKESY